MQGLDRCRRDSCTEVTGEERAQAALGDSGVRAARAPKAVLQEQVWDKGAAAWEKRFLGVGVSQLSDVHYTQKFQVASLERSLESTGFPAHMRPAVCAKHATRPSVRLAVHCAIPESVPGDPSKSQATGKRGSPCSGSEAWSFLSPHQLG